MASLTLVQLSDIHFRSDESGLKIPSAAALAEAIRMLVHTDHVVIALTGDITFSGLPQEYDYAKSVILQIVNSLRLARTAKVHVLALPGNHDLDFTINPTHERVVGTFGSHSLPSRQDLELLAEGQRAFFKFVNDVQTDGQWNNPFLSSSVVKTQHGIVQFSAINSALCSVRTNSVPGNLFLSLDDLPERQPGAQLHVAMIHHPLHWLHQSIRTDVPQKFSDSCEMVITGHEHEEDQMTVVRRQMKSTHYSAAPALSSSESDSAFNISVIDIPKRELTISHLTAKESKYHISDTLTVTLQDASLRNAELRLRPSFLEEIEGLDITIKHTSGREVTHESIFVYPFLALTDGPDSRKSSDAKFRRIDGSLLADTLVALKQMLLVSEPELGKTVLIRRLLKDCYARGLNPIILNAGSCVKTSPEEAVNAAIQAQYETADHSDFYRKPVENRVLLVDDLDFLLEAGHSTSKLVEFASREFGVVLYACSDFALLQDPISGSDARASLWKLTRAEIMPMGYQKRGELIIRWIDHDGRLSDSDRQKRTVALQGRVDELIQQKVIPSQPLSITVLLESLDGGVATSEQLGAHGYHCQRLILQALHRAQEQRQRSAKSIVPDNIALELLGRICVILFDKQESEVSVARCRQVAIEMRDELILTFSVNEALDTLEQAGLIHPRGGSTYACVHEHVVLFCVANLYANWLNNESQSANVRTRVSALIETLEDDRSANVLIFFTFLTRDSETIDAIRLQSMCLFEELRPSDFSKDVEKFFDSTPRLTMPMSPVLADERRKRAIARDEYEHTSAEAEKALMLKVTETGLEHLRTMRRALQCIRVLGQTLKAYPTTLSGNEKKSIATEAYTVGFKSFSEFLRAIESAQELVRVYFGRLAKGYVNPSDIDKAMKVQDRDMSEFVRLGALSVIRRIARSVGSPSLRDLYPLVKVSGSEIGVTLVNAAIDMEVLHDAQFKELAVQYQEYKADGNHVAAEVLQRLMWEYVHVVLVHGADRKSILEKMDIVELPSMLGGGARVQKGLPSHASIKTGKKKRIKRR